MLRSDYGTENTALATIQLAFRLQHTDALAEKSFMYGGFKTNIVSCVLGHIWFCVIIIYHSFLQLFARG